MTNPNPCTISFIVAVADNGVIGYLNNIPWKSTTDMQHFREITMGKPVIMGRKTWESLKRPLDGRDNIVITNDLAFKAEGAETVHSTEEALERAMQLSEDEGNCEVMVIGGSMIYAELLDRADRIYLTQVHLKPSGDTYFWSLGELQKRGWREIAREHRSAGPRDDADLTFCLLKQEKSAS